MDAGASGLLKKSVAYYHNKHRLTEPICVILINYATKYVLQMCFWWKEEVESVVLFGM